MMRFFLCFILFFIYNFSINFFFIPVQSRYIFAIVGIYFLLKNYKLIKFSKSYIKKWGSLIKATALLLLVAIISALINGYYDSHFFRYPVSVIISLLSGYGIVVTISLVLKQNLSIRHLLILFVASSLFQCVFSLFLFLNPSIRDFAFGLLSVSETYDAAIDHMIGGTGRVLSYGAGFFMAGIMFSLSIIFSAILYNTEHEKYLKVFYIVSAIVIAMIGSTISRTTLVGLVGFLFVLLHGQKARLSSLIITMSVLLFVSIGALSYFERNVEGNSAFGEIFDRAFSVYYFYKETGTLQDRKSMTGNAIYPDNEKTWLIGDGKMNDPNHSSRTEFSYYKNVDIGLCRILFGIGILGLIAYSIIQYLFCRLCGFKRFETVILFSYYIIFMQKGLVSLDVNLAALIMFGVFIRVQDIKLITKHVMMENK